jgi:hypothetical protein
VKQEGKDRIAAALERLEQAVRFEVGWRLASEVDAAAPEIERRARAGVTAQLNRSVRGLLAAEDWKAALVEAARPFASRVELFFVEELPLESAPAFRNAIESREPVVALRTPGELSAAIAARGAGPRCCLFPVVADGGVRAVLYAEGDAVDMNALEMLAVVAGAAYRQPRDAATARQFARARVAEMVLYHNRAVRLGRERRDLYSTLQKEIDSAREAYAGKFSSLEDHLHAELVETLANGDASALGENYPGPIS